MGEVPPILGRVPDDDDQWDDALQNLLSEDGELSPSVIRERSAAERVARTERAAELQRRLEREAEERKVIELDERRQARKRKLRGDTLRGRSSRLKQVAVFGAILAAAALVAYFPSGGDDPVATSDGEDGGANEGEGDIVATIRPINWPTEAPEIAEEPLGVPPAPPVGEGGYTFLYRQDDGTSDRPVAFDPCRTIRYVVRPDGAPEWGQQALTEAITAVSAATGLQFEDAGATTELPITQRPLYQPERYGDAWAPVAIAWSDETETPGLAGYIAGMATGSAVQDFGDQLVFVSGQVILDAPDLTAIAASGDGYEVARATIMHELGHLVGLDHVADPAQLMFSEGTDGVVAFGDGDLRGLAQLGSGDCFPDV